MIPLPIDLGDGRLLWRRSRHRWVTIEPHDGAVRVVWADGSDAGRFVTTRYDRVLQDLRWLYAPT